MEVGDAMMHGGIYVIVEQRLLNSRLTDEGIKFSLQ